MFEQQIESEKQRLQEIAALGVSPYHGGISASFLADSPFLPEPYRQYFAAETAWRIHEARTELLGNPHFRLDDEAAAAGFWSNFDETLRNGAHFTADDVEAVIGAAVTARVNFLLRPRMSLRWFVFRGEQTLAVSEILLRLDYFSDYRYLTDGLRSAIAEARRPDDSLTAAEFAGMAEEVDNNVILDLTPHQFVGILAPVFEFFSPAGQNTIPTEALIIFLDDKHVEPIAQELERAYFDENCAEVSEEIFLGIVTEILDAIEEESLPETAGEAEVEAQESTEGTEIPTGGEIPQTEPVDTVAAQEVPAEIIPETETSDKFLVSPGAVSAMLAVKEFIRPEFGGHEAGEKFVLKFAPDPEKAQESAEELPESGNESVELPAASAADPGERLDEVEESLEELEESLEELEHIAEEAEAALEQVAETLEELGAELDAEIEVVTQAQKDAAEQVEAAERFPDAAGAAEAGSKEPPPVNPEDVVSLVLQADDYPAAGDDYDLDYTVAPIEETDIEANLGDPAGEIIADDVISLVLDAGEMVEEQQEEIFYDPAGTTTPDTDEGVSGGSVEATGVAAAPQEFLPAAPDPIPGEAAGVLAAQFPLLSTVVSDKRDRYVKKLFGKDPAAYQAFEDEINGCYSWKEAAQTFDRFLISHGISHDNSLAVELRNAVRGRYST